MFCVSFVLMKIKLHFNCAIVFSESSLKRPSVNNTHTSYSLPLYVIALSICACSLSRLSQINVKIRNACNQPLSVVYAQRYSVGRHLFNHFS